MSKRRPVPPRPSFPPPESSNIIRNKNDNNNDNMKDISVTRSSSMKAPSTTKALYDPPRKSVLTQQVGTLVRVLLPDDITLTNGRTSFSLLFAWDVQICQLWQKLLDESSKRHINIISYSMEINGQRLLKHSNSRLYDLKKQSDTAKVQVLDLKLVKPNIQTKKTIEKLRKARNDTVKTGIIYRKNMSKLLKKWSRCYCRLGVVSLDFAVNEQAYKSGNYDSIPLSFVVNVVAHKLKVNRFNVEFLRDGQLTVERFRGETQQDAESWRLEISNQMYRMLTDRDRALSRFHFIQRRANISVVDSALQHRRLPTPAIILEEDDNNNEEKVNTQNVPYHRIKSHPVSLTKRHQRLPNSKPLILPSVSKHSNIKAITFGHHRRNSSVKLNTTTHHGRLPSIVPVKSTRRWSIDLGEIAHKSEKSKELIRFAYDQVVLESWRLGTSAEFAEETLRIGRSDILIYKFLLTCLIDPHEHKKIEDLQEEASCSCYICCHGPIDGTSVKFNSPIKHLTSAIAQEQLSALRSRMTAWMLRHYESFLNAILKHINYNINQTEESKVIVDLSIRIIYVLLQRLQRHVPFDNCESCRTTSNQLSQYILNKGVLTYEALIAILVTRTDSNVFSSTGIAKQISGWTVNNGSVWKAVLMAINEIQDYRKKCKVLEDLGWLLMRSEAAQTNLVNQLDWYDWWTPLLININLESFTNKDDPFHKIYLYVFNALLILHENNFNNSNQFFDDLAATLRSFQTTFHNSPISLNLSVRLLSAIVTKIRNCFVKELARSMDISSIGINNIVELARLLRLYLFMSPTLGLSGTSKNLRSSMDGNDSDIEENNTNEQINQDNATEINVNNTSRKRPQSVVVRFGDNLAYGLHIDQDDNMVDYNLVDKFVDLLENVCKPLELESNLDGNNNNKYRNLLDIMNKELIYFKDTRTLLFEVETRISSLPKKMITEIVCEFVKSPNTTLAIDTILNRMTRFKSISKKLNPNIEDEMLDIEVKDDVSDDETPLNTQKKRTSLLQRLEKRFSWSSSKSK